MKRPKIHPHQMEDVVITKQALDCLCYGMAEPLIEGESYATRPDGLVETSVPVVLMMFFWDHKEIEETLSEVIVRIHSEMLSKIKKRLH